MYCKLYYAFSKNENENEIVRADKSLSTIVTSAGKRTARMLVAYFVFSQCCHVALGRRGLFYERK